MTDLRAALAEVRALAADTRLRSRFDVAVGRVAEWRYADSYSAPHRPEPWHAERANRKGGWRAGPPSDEHGDALRIGFDSAGRPVAVDRVWRGESDMVFEVWEHDHDRWVLFARDGGDEKVSLLFGAPDRVALVVSAAGRGDDLEVERITWDGDVAVRGDRASAAVTGWPSAHAWRAEVDGDGRLVRILNEVSSDEFRDDNRLSAESVEDGLLAALDLAATIEPGRPGWQARFHAPATSMRPTDELVDVLAAGIADAVAAAYRDAAMRETFVIDLRPGGREDDSRDPLPGVIRIGTRPFRDRMRRFSSTNGDAISRLGQGVEDGTVAQRDLREFCDDETLAACREINGTLAPGRPFDDPEVERAREALGLLGAALARWLNHDTDFADTVEPFLVQVRIGHPFGGRDPDVDSMHAVDADAVAAWRASLRSEVAPDDARPPEASVEEARHDRAALERWLARRGLGEHAHRIAYEVARPVLRLLPSAGARSRIGGPPLLPPGEPWPDAAGRPLTFLAALDLSELPAEELPDEGWLLFFANLDFEGDEGDFEGEPTPNEEGAPARVLPVPPGAEPVEAAPRGQPFGHRAVAPVEQLLLPDDIEAPGRAGLDPAAAHAYEEIASLLRYGTEDQMLGHDHWVLGVASGAQGYQAQEEVQLLFVGADDELDFMFADGGPVWFSLSREALAARDWSAVVAEADSG